MRFDFEEVLVNGDIIGLEAALFDSLINNNYEWHLVNSIDPISLIGEGRIIQYKFDEPGIFTICVYTETADYSDGVTSCKDFIVDFRSIF